MDNRYPLPFSMWWWMRWFVIGFLLWCRVRKIGAMVDKRVGIRMTSSIQTVSCLHRWNRDGSRRI